MLKIMNSIQNIVGTFFTNQLKLSDYLASQNGNDCYFDHLKQNLKSTVIEVTETRSDCFFAKFSERKSEYVLCFDLAGKLLYIEYEYWKDMNVYFNLKNRNSSIIKIV